MSLATYSDLLTALGEWRDRSGDAVVTGNAPDWIKLAEAELTRALPLRVMWVNGDLIGFDDSRELDLPADFAEPDWLKLTTNDQFRPITKSTSGGMQYYSTASATPDEWCINGDHIDLNRPCSGALTFLFRYRQKFALSEASPTNWLLTNHPDIYLGKSLMWSGLHLVNADAAVWAQKAEQGIRELRILDAKADADVPLQVDPALLRNNGGGYRGGYWWNC